MNLPAAAVPQDGVYHQNGSRNGFTTGYTIDSGGGGIPQHNLNNLTNIDFGNKNNYSILNVKNGVLRLGTGKMGSGAGKMGYGAEEMDYAAGKMDYGAGEMDYEAGKMDYGAGEMDYGVGERDYGAGEMEDRKKTPYGAPKMSNGSGEKMFVESGSYCGMTFKRVKTEKI